MAKIKLNFPLTNSLGDHSMYLMHGVEKTILRAKGGPNLRQVKTMPKLEKMRNNGSEFGGLGKLAGSIRRTLYAVTSLSDFNYSGALTAIAKNIQKMDTTSRHGKRDILLSQYPNMINGFNLTKKNPFDTIVTTSPITTISRDQYKAEVSFPELFQGSNLKNPSGLPYFKIICSMAIATDMVWSVNGYVPKNDQVQLNPVNTSTGWISTTQGLPPTKFHLPLPAGSFLDETATLIVAIGIDFGYATTNEEIKSVKYGGSAKILAVG